MELLSEQYSVRVKDFVEGDMDAIIADAASHDMDVAANRNGQIASGIRIGTSERSSSPVISAVPQQ